MLIMDARVKPAHDRRRAPSPLLFDGAGAPVSFSFPPAAGGLPPKNEGNGAPGGRKGLARPLRAALRSAARAPCEGALRPLAIGNAAPSGRSIHRARAGARSPIAARIVGAPAAKARAHAMA